MWGEKDETDDSYSLIDEGNYVAKLTDASLDSTKEGSEEDPWTLKVEYTLTSGKFEKRKLWQNFRFNEKSVRWLRWQLSVMNVWEDLKGSTDQKDAAMKTTDSIYKLVQAGNVHFNIEVTHNEHGGKTYSNLKLKEMISGPIKTESQSPSFDSSEEMPF